jgi:putative transposase
VKVAWIESYRDRFPVTRLCRWLDVSRSGYCQWRSRASSERSIANAVLDVHVASIHAQSDQTYGRVRIVEQLRSAGQVVGHERVRQSLLRQALRPVYKRPYRITTDSEHDKPIAPNVLKRRFDGWQPDQAWVADVTYIHTKQGWLYLAVVLDLATRRIVGWSMSKRMKAGLVCDALTMAYQHRRPGVGLIMHTDRGSQYASKKYRKLISDYSMTASMSRRANCWDNAVAESFFKTLKVERVYRQTYATQDHARIDIVNWMEGFYDRDRLHSSIGFRSPVDAQASLVAA